MSPNPTSNAGGTDAASAAMPSDLPRFTTLISAERLHERIDAGLAPLILDCSHDLADPRAGERDYLTAHIPGAVHLHLDRDLSDPPSPAAGRHPLPQRQALAARFAALGLRTGQQVVVYDRAQGAFAARAWWLLRWLGHAPVAVLDGGWQAWLHAGGDIQSGPAGPRAPGQFTATPSLVGIVDIDAVLRNLNSRSRSLLVVDARSPQRYAGEGETLDPVGGHIPGAVNRFFRDNLQADGRFKPAAQLRDEWLQILDAHQPKTLVSQCGSGVTACHNLLALEHAGFHGALLYPGSWSQWCADARNPVARGAQA